MNKKYIKLDLPFDISPSTSFLSLHLNEIDEANDISYLKFIGWFRETNEQHIIRITFKRLLCGKMSSMSGELLETNESIGMIENSDWLQEINNNQIKLYPEYPNNFNEMKHYFFIGHDTGVEIIAESFDYEIK